MEPMKSKMNKMFSPATKFSVDGKGGTNVEDLEIRPGGMLVQKRNAEMNPSSVSIPTIKVRVKYGTLYHEIRINPQASFGELKKMLAEPTKLHHLDQKLIFKNKERDSKEYLDVARVKDGSKIVLEEDIVSRERRCVELLRNANAEKSSKSLAEINLEVDKLAGQVTALEATASTGGKVAETDVDNLTELLMMKLIKLDGIVAEGDLKLQRRLQVKRVQKYIGILDMLKYQSSKSSSNGAKIQLQQQENPIGHMSRDSKPVQKPRAPWKLEKSVRTIPAQQQPQKHSESVVVTTKWETFD
ncbi:BAG family molecular chaperone regulator 1 [Prunus yedoensis var. nudiflora]|uniref:BAG family molecular chaperone regulator 1 n=1 Tax=Prunus yedoensis var. nudiflora TaxID=2094558 RepID=A0A315B4Z0_PRUYE|nr:BAG family molecular chaperone regulator 1 [Prunus yedoensis var. nudiflora]